MNKIYAGIGSRKTPDLILNTMQLIAGELCRQNWLLRSGNARGADSAFQKGVMRIGKFKEIHLPWDGYNYGRTTNPDYVVPIMTKELLQITSDHHPKWKHLMPEAKLFMLRNTTIILGQDLQSPVSMILCWTPNGQITGGTGHALRIAQTYNIPVFNLAIQEDWPKLEAFTAQIDESVDKAA